MTAIDPGHPWRLWGGWSVWVATLGVLYAAVPPSPDQSQHDYMGWILLQGGAPYVDYVEHNWPGGPWLHALATRLFGVNLYSWHVFDLLLLVPVLLAALRPLREAAGRRAAAWSLFLYPALYTTMRSWVVAGERDALAGHLLFLSTCLYWRASSPRRAWPWAAAAAAPTKPTAALFAPLLLSSDLLHPPRPERRFVAPAVFAAGYAATLTAALGLLYAEGSSWRAFADAAIRFDVESYGGDRVPPLDQLRRAVEALSTW